jgi:hypothetical protein
MSGSGEEKFLQPRGWLAISGGGDVKTWLAKDERLQYPHAVNP